MADSPFDDLDEITDMISDPVFPFFWHFSMQGIVPRIITAELEIVTLECVKGPRLGFAIPEMSLEQLVPVYTQLGNNVANINKYCIQHRHLHTENVVLAKNKPVIIDWGMSSYLGIIDVDFWKQADSKMLLETTQETLGRAGKSSFYAPLESAYWTSFEAAFKKAHEKSPRDICEESLNKFGF